MMIIRYSHSILLSSQKHLLWPHFGEQKLLLKFVTQILFISTIFCVLFYTVDLKKTITNLLTTKALLHGSSDCLLIGKMEKHLDYFPKLLHISEDAISITWLNTYIGKRHFSPPSQT